MRKFLKFLGVLAVTLVVLVIALAIAVPLLFDLNDYKDEIAAEVEAETGRELTIDGDLELTIYPWLGVRSGAMSLAQREGFGDEAFASFEEASIRIRLLPYLLRRDIEVGRIGLKGMQLRLVRDVDGRDNWSDLAARDPAPDAMPQDAERPDYADLERIEVAGVSLENAYITYRDERAGTSYVFENLNLRSGPLRLGQPVELDLDALVSSAVPQWRSTVEFSGRVEYSHASQELSLAIELAQAGASGGALPADQVTARLSGRVDGNLDTETWNLEELDVAVTARGGEFPEQDTEFRITGDAWADLAAQTMEFGPLHLTGMDMDITVNGRGESILDGPQFRGQLDVAAFSPRALLQALERDVPETRDAGALAHFELSSGFEATRSSVHLEGLTARLDDTALGGSFGIADFERRALRFDLELDALDLDRYLPPDTPEAEDVEPGSLDAFEIPEDLLRGLDMDGNIRIGRMTAVGIRSEDIEARIQAAGGELRVHPARAGLYGGRYEGDISIDVTGNLPRLTIDERVDGVQAGMLFRDLFSSERITGTAELAANLAASGTTIGQMRRTLDGRVQFAFRDGAVHGFDLWHMIRDARAVLRREERPVKEGPDETPFDSLTGTGSVRQGVMQNDDLAARTPFMRVTGRGSIDMADETLDYRLRAAIQHTPGVEEGSAEAQDLQGLTVPVRISGPFDELKYRVDIGEVLKEEVKSRVKDLIIEEIRRRTDR